MRPLDASLDPGGDRSATQLAGGPRSPAPAAPSRAAATSRDETPSGAPGCQGDTAAFNLERLADALGIDPDELLRQVSSSAGLGDRLNGSGATGYGSSIADTVSGGIVVDRYA